MSKLVCSGALIYALDTRRILFLHRASSKHSGVWGLVGGKNEGSETPWQGLEREVQEEIGEVNIIKALPLETFISQNNYFFFYTYFCLIKNEFIPTINHEHDGYAWASFMQWPMPLHPGLETTLSKKINTEKIKTVIDVVDSLVFSNMIRIND